MARHIRNQAAPDAQQAEVSSGAEPISQGTANAPPLDPNPPARTIHGLVEATPREDDESSGAGEEDAAPTVAKRYRVVAGPENIVYAGQVMKLRIGKEYGDNEVDLDMLRRQGVRFEEASP